MLQSISDQTHNSGDGTAAPESRDAAAAELGFVSEEGERNSGGGNRWPRQETVALIKIRSDMDIAFRDSNLKGPLWDEVSRKLAELGYHRSAKKCKEKFENVYKYHKRTKDGRISKQDGKTYRFFEQLEALEGQTSTPIVPSIQTPTRLTNSTTSNNPASLPQPCNVQSVINFANVLQNNGSPIVMTTSNVITHSNIHSGMVSNSTSSSTSSEPERRGKRKWKDFFERIMKEVIEKQEELQMRFLETLERRERDRMVREEAWRVQEMAKMNREHDILVHERSVTAAKDAAVIAFLQKMTEQGPISPSFQPQMSIQVKLKESPLPQPPPPPPLVSLPPPPPPPPPPLVSLQPPIQTPAPPLVSLQPPVPILTPAPVPALAPAPAPPPPVSLQPPIRTPAPALPIKKIDNMGDNSVPPSPSRWPKAEIQALISLRTTLDMKYQENGPKGPLWEEISMGMRKLGYNRNAKRCKEKWENINKYYKKMKESNKKRPQDAKTCPYFHQLDAIYKEKAKTEGPINHGLGLNPETLVAPIMAQPERQWPVLAPVGQNVDQNNDGEDSGEDEDEEDAFEIVQSKPTPMENVE